MSEDLRLKISMLERTVLDLGAQLFELKGSFERSKEQNESFQATIFSIKSYLDKEGIMSLDIFDDEMALIQDTELSSSDDLESPPHQATNDGKANSKCRKQKH
jgi:hypothetical protein